MKLNFPSGGIFVIYLAAFSLFVFLYFFAADLGIKKYAFIIALIVVVSVLVVHYRYLKHSAQKHEEKKKKYKIKPTMGIQKNVISLW